MDEALKDKRFSHILKDPRFRKVPKNLKKIKVDKRFAGMFDKNVFNGRSKQDERGRALEFTPSENLKKLYDTTNDSSEEEEEEDINTKDSLKQSFQKGKISKTSKGKLQLRQNRKDEKKKISEQDSDVSEDEDQLKSKNKSIKKKENRVSSNKIKASSVKSSESEDSDPEDSKDLKLKESEKSESEESEKSESEEGEKSESKESEDSESEESDSSETGSIQGDFDHRWEEFDEEVVRTEDISRRLAVCNMDWDRIRASDLFVTFNSFKPESGSVYSVKIYPSDYGLKRMEEEKQKGPPELVEKTLASDEEEDMEDKKGAKYNQEKLRQYQINRLRYYYAVVECDTPETANHLYEQLNGLEYESSSIRFDLRFVPDDTTFDQEPTSMVGAHQPPNPTEYKPRLFVTTALQQVKVNLTWDETNPQRRETLQKAFTDLDSVEKDLKDYLASSSSEESEVEAKVEESGEKLSSKERIAKYRALLFDLEEKEKKDEDENDKEITWDPDVKEKTKKIVKEKMDSTSTPFDEILKKKKERRQKKQQEKRKMNNEDKEISSDDSDSISDEELSKKSTEQLAQLQLISDAKEKETPPEKKKGKKLKKKKKEQKKDEFKVDVTDPRFSAIYTHHDYNIDPSDPHFKSTEGTLAFMREKKRREQRLHEKDLPEEWKSKKMKYR